MITGPIVARSLSRVQCDELIEHIDTVRPVIHGKHEDATRTALLYKRLIRYYPPNATTPDGTRLTDLGREVVCAVLADWAEALARPHVAELMVRRLVREDIDANENHRQG